MKIWMRTAALTAVLAASLVAAPLARGQEPTSEIYTLDGQKADSATAQQGGGGCAAGVSASGTIPCFSSDKARDTAILTALRAGEVPPGYNVVPVEAERQKQIGVLERSLGKSSASRSRSRARARAADYYQCLDATVTRVYTGAAQTGNYGFYGSNGPNVWVDHSGTFNNSITSYWAMNPYTSRWHDGPGGTGDYYGAGYACRAIHSLAASWDDRFSSYAVW